MSSNIQDQIEAVGKRQKIYRRANKIKENSNPDATNIAAIYEKYSLQNVELGLENRRKIRAGTFEKSPTPANKAISHELLPSSFSKLALFMKTLINKVFKFSP